VSRFYTVPGTGTGTDEDCFRPAVPDETLYVGYPRASDGLFLLATDADLSGVPGVTELTDSAIDAACAAWGIDRDALQ
jgi:hypothetical protein